MSATMRALMDNVGLLGAAASGVFAVTGAVTSISPMVVGATVGMGCAAMMKVASAIMEPMPVPKKPEDSKPADTGFEI